MTKRKWNVTTELPRHAAQCSWVRHWLPGYLRHELTAVQHQQIQAHLAQCDACAQHLQEARLLDGDLQAEADRFQPRLSRDAALRIQNQVYRRMQRSLAWQRTGQILQLSTAVAALILLLMGSFVFGRFWLPSLANTAAEASPNSQMLPPESAPVATAVPTLLPAIPSPVEPVIELEESVGNGRLNAWDRWHSATPGQSPEQLAASIMQAALTHDAAYLNGLFVGMGAAQQPTANLWLQIGGRCAQSLTADDFAFTRRPIPLPTITSVSIWHNNHQVGEIKMRQIAGEWFATFTRTPAVSPCPQP